MSICGRATVGNLRMLVKKDRVMLQLRIPVVIRYKSSRIIPKEVSYRVMLLRDRLRGKS